MYKYNIFRLLDENCWVLFSNCYPVSFKKLFSFHLQCFHLHRRVVVKYTSRSQQVVINTETVCVFCWLTHLTEAGVLSSCHILKFCLQTYFSPFVIDHQHFWKSRIHTCVPMTPHFRKVKITINNPEIIWNYSWGLVAFKYILIVRYNVYFSKCQYCLFIND